MFVYLIRAQMILIDEILAFLQNGVCNYSLNYVNTLLYLCSQTRTVSPILNEFSTGLTDTPPPLSTERVKASLADTRAPLCSQNLNTLQRSRRVTWLCNV